MKRFILIILTLALAACKEPILHNLTENEGNKLLTRLHERGIIAEKKLQSDGTWALAVKRSDAILALSLLSHARVFRRLDNARSELASGMLPNRETQRFQYERALASDIESTLMALDGVLESRVHLNLPPMDPIFGRSTEKDHNSSGSVLLITDKTFAEGQREIQVLVAGAAGISADSISVLISGPQSVTGIDLVQKDSSNEQHVFSSVSNVSQSTIGSTTPEIATSATHTDVTKPDMQQQILLAAQEKEPSGSESTNIDYLLWGVTSIVCLLFVGLSSRYRQRSIWRKRALSRRRDEFSDEPDDNLFPTGDAA